MRRGFRVYGGSSNRKGTLATALGTIAVWLSLATLAGAATPSDLLSHSSLGQTVVNPDGSIIGVGSNYQFNEWGTVPETSRSGTSLVVTKLSDDGSLDPEFASGGIKMITPEEGERTVELMKAGLGGVILATSRRLFRIDSEGNLDPGFGDGGVVGQGDLGGSAVTAATIQSDGKVVVATSDGLGGIDVARFTIGGELDDSFGTDGVAHFGGQPPEGGKPVVADTIGIDGDGRIILAGTKSVEGWPPERVPAAMRLLPGGQLDSAFGPGDGGYAESVTGVEFFDQITDLVVDSDGNFRIYGVTDERTQSYESDANVGYFFGEDGMAQGEPRSYGFGGIGVLAETPGGPVSRDPAKPNEFPSFNLVKSNTDGSTDLGFTAYRPALTPGSSGAGAVTYSPDDDTLIVSGSAEGFDCRGECSLKGYMVVAKLDADTGAPVPGFGIGGAALIPRNECAFGVVAHEPPTPWKHCRIKPPVVSADFKFRHGATRRPALSATVELAGGQDRPRFVNRYLSISLPRKIRLRRGARSKLAVDVNDSWGGHVRTSLVGRNLRIRILSSREGTDESGGIEKTGNDPIEVTVRLRRGALAGIPRYLRRVPLRFGVGATYTPSSKRYGYYGPDIDWYEPNRTRIAERVRPIGRR